MSLRARAWLFLGIVALAAAACGAYFARGVPLQTNLLAMLPPTERDPVAEEVIARLSAAIGGRALFVVSHRDEAAARRAAQRFAHELQGAGGWRLVLARLPSFDRSAPANLYAARRFGLLSDADRAQLASGEFALRETALRQVVVPLLQPGALPLGQDPFGFFGRWMAWLAPAADGVRR